MGAYYLVKEVGSDHGHLCCMYYLVKEVGSDYGNLCSRTLHLSLSCFLHVLSSEGGWI